MFLSPTNIDMYVVLCFDRTQFVWLPICRFMARWELWRCTSGRTRYPVAVRCAAKRSRVHGCFKVTCAHTPGNVRSDVRTVSAPSPTDRICERTCRHTPESRDIAVRSAASRSLVCHCWPSITRLGLAAATSPGTPAVAEAFYLLIPEDKLIVNPPVFALVLCYFADD